MIIEKVTREEEVTEQDNQMWVVIGLVVINTQTGTRDIEIMVFIKEDMDLQAETIADDTIITKVFHLVLEVTTAMIMVARGILINKLFLEIGKQM